MMNSSNLEVDPSSISEIRTLLGTQDVDEPRPVPSPSEIRSAPTNHLSVIKQGFSKQTIPISGHYFIDLSIPPVPQSVSHVVSAAENLLLHTTCGPVTADVWVTGNNEFGQANINLFSNDGTVRAQVHDAFSGNEGKHRPSLNIEVRAYNGDVSVSLPRCFRGLITIKSSYQPIAFSPAFEKRTALLSDSQNACVYFVGDRPRSWMWCGGSGSDNNNDNNNNNDDNNNNDNDNDNDNDNNDDNDNNNNTDNNNNDNEGRQGTVRRGSEEQLDELYVGNGHIGVQIRWDGEPELP